MSDEEAFLRAIAAAPDDDLPRLVYADWLDERGDPRAEYLRLEVQRRRLSPRDERMPELLLALDCQLQILRPHATPNWLSHIDRTARHSVFWPQDVCRQASREGRVGRPLDRVDDRGNAGGRLPKGIRPGDYVYVVAYHTRTLHVLARMRVTDIIYHPFSRNHVGIDYLGGAEGTAIRLARPVPPDVLARVGWYSGKEERRAKLNVDGTGLANPDAINRTLRLTPQTAWDFDDLLRDEDRAPNLFTGTE